MKLTEEQLVVLQDTLNEGVTYRETYEEVYDHLLTALEHSDNSLSLPKTLNNIMQSDFGGFKGLRSIEKKRRWMVGRQMAKKQFWYFIDHLKFPLLPITLIIFVALYYLVINIKFNAFGFFLAVAVLPSLFNGLRYFTIGYKFKSTQKSIKDLPFKVISNFPYYFFFMGSIICQGIYFINVENHNYLEFYNLPPLLLSSLYALYITYHISFFRLYRDEFAKLN